MNVSETLQLMIDSGRYDPRCHGSIKVFAKNPGRAYMCAAVHNAFVDGIIDGDALACAYKEIELAIGPHPTLWCLLSSRRENESEKVTASSMLAFWRNLINSLKEQGR